MVSKKSKNQIDNFTLSFEFYDLSIPTNHSEGICILWNRPNIMATVLLKEDGAIHILVFSKLVSKNQ